MLLVASGFGLSGAVCCFVSAAPVCVEYFLLLVFLLQRDAMVGIGVAAQITTGNPKGRSQRHLNRKHVQSQT